MAQKAAKEKATMAEKLKVSESSRRALEEEVKQHSSGSVAIKEKQVTLEETISLLSNRLAVDEAELQRRAKQASSFGIHGCFSGSIKSVLILNCAGGSERGVHC